MTNPKHTDTSRSDDLVGDDFAPIWDESILLAEHEAVQASVYVGGWLSAALDDPNVCDAMKTDINRWFSAGFLYLDEVRKLMQTEREALEAENGRLRGVIKGAQEILSECRVSFGICACGEDMQTHGTGHSPTDQGHIAVGRWLEEARAALGEKQ